MNAPRSYLFVPGDSAKKIAKAYASGADAVVVDLEDSVAVSQKTRALQTCHDFLAGRNLDPDGPEIWVRVNVVDSEAALAELAALPLARLAGVFHPKLAAQTQLERMGHWLDTLEVRDGLTRESIRIIGIITETPRAMVGELAASLARGHARLRGYSWGTEDLSAALGRAPLVGQTDAQLQLARAAQMHCLLMATAAGVDAIDGISTDFRDLAPLAAHCEHACELGYVAKLAIHPAQLDVIHAGITPHAAVIDWAERVCALAADNPDAGSLSLDGRMIDQPHIDVAARILARARGPTR